MNHQRLQEAVADAIGMPISPGGTVQKKVAVVGPLDMNLPLDMRFSHGISSFTHHQARLNCWRVVGNLYMAVVAGGSAPMCYVVLLDKGKWTRPSNIVSEVDKARSRGKIKSFRDYLEFMQEMVVGVWLKPNPATKTYDRVEWVDADGKVADLDFG